MAATVPTILATSGGFREGERTMLELGPLVHHAVELAGVEGRAPRLGYLGTAIGDQEFFAYRMGEAARVAGFAFTDIRLFSMPNHADLEETMHGLDAIWVMGGSVANLLAVWRVHGLPDMLRRAWQAGVVLSGISAGSLCWFVGGTTDSFGPELRPVTNGLGFLPYANSVHHGAPGRRELIHALVADGRLPEAHCTDDGVGLVYHGTQLVEAVSETDGALAYVVHRDGDGAIEEPLQPRRL